MPLIALIGHGQSKSMAKDDASYGQLSPLGYQQARWLGEPM